MSSAYHFIENALNKRESDGSLRKLKYENNLIDFCSNDYLGYANSIDLQNRIKNFNLENNKVYGSSGSRLISGNYKFTEEVEKYISNLHNAEAGLIFNSGFDANLGLLSSVPQKNDTIIFDELCHASFRDGIRLSFAKNFSFKHNDIKDLESKLKIGEGNIYVVVESVYSMDGDLAPLIEISNLCEVYFANLIVDEAHATGVIGDKGEGLIQFLNLQKKVFARIHTFGKAIGCHGAIVLGSESLRKYLINFARSFIYTTALPYHSMVSIKCAYEKLINDCESIEKLRHLINLFKFEIKKIENIKLIESNTAIQCLVIAGNENVKNASSYLQKKGLDVRAIMSPTVPKGKERLRICLHSFNTENDVNELVDILSTLSFSI